MALFRKIPKAVLALGAVSIGILVLTARLCTARSSPFNSVPLDITGPTSTTAFDVHVTKSDIYSVSLSYPYIDSVGRAKAWKLAGGETLQGNSWQESGAPFVFQIRINEMHSGKVVLNKQVTHPKLSSWGAEWLSAELVDVNLVEGSYQVLVDRSGSLVEEPSEPLQLQFSEAYEGK
jgi:hypothetical protein